MSDSEFNREEKLKLARKKRETLIRELCTPTISEVDVHVGEMCLTIIPFDKGMTRIIKCKSCSSRVAHIPSSIHHEGKNYEIIGIEERAFEGMAGIEIVNLPSTVKHIGFRAFCNMPDLKEIIFPGIEYIRVQAFYDCPKLTHVSIPDSISAIETAAFSRTGLKNIVFPEKIRIKGDKVLNDTPIEQLVIPEGVTEIGQLMSGSDGLEEITIPRSFDLDSIVLKLFPKLKTIKIN